MCMSTLVRRLAPIGKTRRLSVAATEVCFLWYCLSLNSPHDPESNNVPSLHECPWAQSSEPTHSLLFVSEARANANEIYE